MANARDRIGGTIVRDGFRDSHIKRNCGVHIFCVYHLCGQILWLQAVEDAEAGIEPEPLQFSRVFFPGFIAIYATVVLIGSQADGWDINRGIPNED